MFDLAGDDAIQFGLGEPDFQPPNVAIKAFSRAMEEGRNKYTTTAGLPDLRKKIAESWHHRESSLDESNVCITMSGTNALLDIFLALVNPGDNVLIPEPYFPLYPTDVVLCGGEANMYPCYFENGFVPLVEDLESRINENTIAILYNFPSNPTGGNVTEEQRDVLVQFAKDNDLWLITDEVYDKIVYDSEHVSFLGAGYDKVIMINSFSKTFAMTGWRIGYLLSPDSDAMVQLTKMQYYVTACSNDAMQYAVLEAMEKASNYPSEMCAEFKGRRDLICKRLNAMPRVSCNVPTGAFYVFPKFDIPEYTSEELAMKMLEGGVLCSPGTAFGAAGEGHLRFAYTIGREDISRGMDRVEEVLSKLV
ncbi:TPA: aminotransferase class I/II-fold pyridoxal phosphate-dependent enzyme [Candidatus Thalassarchaeaceae archaeon]|nr:aminotransferase class I/II-fold pyridoxal phosphate-dependent enzyme [Euryarchaeota archaeon]MDG1547136.1 aminotransferase class I/II-fold pyridoxal phosphate-dependent enzyme [Candidatus Thalassarchaeaceae archaeon]DAC63870.1 MAG TPA: aminotransferase class I/II-fold pyridoxal phosphate-dependent enzyme [Candidatus Poseidoniales archaeon]MDG1553965.1 aminotransferase class I/II-fold pyridoxal phosphate-dependent enzyme [Candidatus Thalassarchaeaceae archaeon]DAC65482.1 MAG TPA: aminotransf|tara:strand:- start:6700 stop:7788 length:1089 start_codon:yes stop_codon:yes gene_type:complete